MAIWKTSLLPFIIWWIDSLDFGNVILVGDLNIDFGRMNGNSKRLGRFMYSENIESSWKKFGVDYTHEYELNNLTHTCTIDHVLWNENFFKFVADAGVLHDPDNTSDHSSIAYRSWTINSFDIYLWFCWLGLYTTQQGFRSCNHNKNNNRCCVFIVEMFSRSQKQAFLRR